MLWLIAVILAVFGVLQLVSGHLLWAIVLFIAAAAVGPGGWSIASRR
jgi:uncharacterized membrane protein (DUF2068 family)